MLGSIHTREPVVFLGALLLAFRVVHLRTLFVLSLGWFACEHFLFVFVFLVVDQLEVADGALFVLEDLLTGVFEEGEELEVGVAFDLEGLLVVDHVDFVLDVVLLDRQLDAHLLVVGVEQLEAVLELLDRVDAGPVVVEQDLVERSLVAHHVQLLGLQEGLVGPLDAEVPEDHQPQRGRVLELLEFDLGLVVLADGVLDAAVLVLDHFLDVRLL
mmetsp:Transcript_44114/g.96300  ORF Transcript_44114/g.96300 Transcript_44114/m.96300 type:complete len:214 (+) Transcript_44114:432-1073(+)